jgi:hypothetical protein
MSKPNGARKMSKPKVNPAQLSLWAEEETSESAAPGSSLISANTAQQEEQGPATIRPTAEALARYHEMSKQAAASWQATWAEAGRAYDLTIQQNRSIGAMIIADRRRDRAMQKADAIMAATMRAAHEQLLASARQRAEGGEGKTSTPAHLEQRKESLVLSTSEEVINFLLTWGEAHNYPDLTFRLPDTSYHGWESATIPMGKDKWINNCHHAYSLEWLRSAVQVAQQIDATEPPRAWLLAWGEQHRYPGFSFAFHYPPRNEDKDRRFGRMGRGKEQWEQETLPPHNQRERYPGEWLEKCIEQVKRFESGECEIPWQINSIADDKE